MAGIFDKFKIKKQPLFTRADAEAINNDVNNGLDRISKSVQPGTAENQEALKPTPEETIQNLPNGGKVPENWNIPDLTKDQNIQKTLEGNKTLFDPNAEGADFLNGLAPISQAEQEERARRAQAVVGIGNLGNSLAALANLFAVSNGASNQTIQPVKGPDIQEYLEKGRQQRLQYAQLQQAQRDADEQMQIKQKELQMKQDAATRKAELDAILNPLKIEYQQKRITAQEYINQARRFGVTEAEAKAKLAETKADDQPILDQARANQIGASAAASYASADARAQEAERKANSNNLPFYSPSYGNITLTKSQVSANLGYLHSLTGEDATDIYGRAKSEKEQIADISKHANDEKVHEGLMNVLRGRKAQSSATTTPTPQQTTTSAQKSSTGVSGGGTGSWGSSIHRKGKK